MDSPILTNVTYLTYSRIPTESDMDEVAEILQKYISSAADSAIPYKKLSTFPK